MKSNTTKFIEDVVNGFQQHKGKASVYCFTESIIPNLVKTVINKFKNKHQSKEIFIVVDSYKTRESIKNAIQDDDIKIISKDYVKTVYSYLYKLIIIIGVNENEHLINFLAQESKFTLCILTKNIMDTVFINTIRKKLPNIEVSVNDNLIKSDRIYSPVEETRCRVFLSDEDKELYKKYTEFINTSIAVFGDLSNIEKCKMGDVRLNISSSEFRYNLARENGWSENLDTNIDFQKQIDEIYNPNILYERACMFYTISKKRRDLLTDNKAKLEEILNICNDNADKRILIVSKRGEFAREITKYLCQNGVACGDYHDCIEDMVAVDDEGNTLLVKSGVNKGKPRIVGSQFISTNNLRRFNQQYINVLSIKNSSNNKLKTTVDLIIITSPLCDSVIDIKQRFTEVDFTGQFTKLYKIYVCNTIEYDKLNKEPKSSLFKVIEKYEQDFVQFDENSGDIIL